MFASVGGGAWHRYPRGSPYLSPRVPFEDVAQEQRGSLCPALEHLLHAAQSLQVGGPVMLAGAELGIPHGQTIAAYSAGYAHTNLLNPFWALPLIVREFEQRTGALADPSRIP